MCIVYLIKAAQSEEKTESDIWHYSNSKGDASKLEIRAILL